jgi:hypothetical protein
MLEILFVGSNNAEWRCAKLLEGSPDAVSHEHA